MSQNFRIVQIFAAGVRVDDGALETETAYRALELLRGAPRILRRDRREPGKAGRMPADRLGELVVEPRRQCRRQVGVENLHPGSGQGDDLPIDACCIHVGEAAVADILDAPQQRLRPLAGAGEKAPQAVKARIVERLRLEFTLIEIDEFGRRPGLLGRDAAVAGRFLDGGGCGGARARGHGSPWRCGGRYARPFIAGIGHRKRR